MVCFLFDARDPASRTSLLAFLCHAAPCRLKPSMSSAQGLKHEHAMADGDPQLNMGEAEGQMEAMPVEPPRFKNNCIRCGTTFSYSEKVSPSCVACLSPPPHRFIVPSL